MPLPVELDLTRWTKVVPEGRTQKVKCLSFACFYYRTLPTPPELASEGTEIAANGELTMERAQAPYWFRTKKAAATEVQKPSILETKEGSPETVTSPEIREGAVLAADLAEGSVTVSAVAAGAIQAANIKTNALTAANVLIPTVPSAGAESLTAVVGAAGIARRVNAVYTAKHEASAKVKIVHNLGTSLLTVDAYISSAKIPTEKLEPGSAAAGAISKVAVTNTNQVELTLVAAEPTGGEEFFYVVTG